jgi:hypothetical protein
VNGNGQAGFATAYLVMLIIGMAVLNAFRVILRHPFDRRKGRTPLWVWLGGIVFATTSAALFVNYHAHRIPLWEWLASSVRPFERITGNLAWYPYAYAGLVTELMTLVIVVAVIAQLHARTAVGGPHPTGCDIALVVWIFAAATISWHDYVAGIWLPLTVALAGSTLWIALAVSRRWAPLDRPPLRAVLAGIPGSGFQAYTWLIEQARKSVRSSENVRDSVQADTSAAPVDRHYVRLAFAFGPYGDPWRTARFATMVAGAFAIIPAAWFMWTEFSNSFWTYAGGQEFGGIQIPTKVVGEVLFWIVPGFLLGLLWRHLPGRAGAIKVLPIAASYVISAMGHLLLSRLLGQDPAAWAVQRSLLVWGVLSMTAIVIDFKTLRMLEREPSSVRYNLATVYGIAGWPARLSGLLPQLVAIALMVYVVIQPDAGLVQTDPLQTLKRGAP